MNSRRVPSHVRLQPLPPSADPLAPAPPTPAGPLHALGDLLAAEEDTFLAALDAMAQGDGIDDVVRYDVSQGLMHQALVLDRPRALFAVRQIVQERGAPPALNTVQGCGRFSDARLVQHARGERPVALTLDLQQRGQVTRVDVARALNNTGVPSLVDLARRDAYRASIRDYVMGHAVRFEAEDLRYLLTQGVLDEQDFCTLVAGAKDPTTALLMEAAMGVISAKALFNYLQPEVGCAVQWVQDGLLSGDALLEHCDAISTEDVRALHASGLISTQTFFQSGRPQLSDVLRWLDAGQVTAKDAARRYALPAARLEQLYRHRQIDAGTYAACWRRGMTLPRGYTEKVGAAQLNDAIVAIPAPRDPGARRSLRLWLCAERIEALEAAEATPHRQVDGAPSMLTRIFRRLKMRTNSRAAKAAASATSQAPTACLACTEPFDAEAPAFKLPGCKHAAHFHAECARRALDARCEQGLPPTCPSVGCEHTLSMADGRAMGINPDAMDKLAMTKLRGFKPQDWHSCGTKDCLGGTVVPLGQARTLHCMHCEADTLIEHRTPVESRLRDVLLQLIDGMGASRPGSVRSCYHCGVATEHVAGCSSMVCGRDTDGSRRAVHGGCGRSWDFIMGLSNVARGGWGQMQHYVPLRGDMVDAGMYAPLLPGTILRSHTDLPWGHGSIQGLVTQNALKRGLVRHGRSGLELA